jgi:hypothetical protein
MNTLGSPDSWTVCPQNIFLETCYGACSKYTKKSNHWCIHHGELRFLNVFTTGELRLPRVFTTGELRLPGVFITRESFVNIKEHGQSLKVISLVYSSLVSRGSLVYSWSGNRLGCQGVVFTDFKEHTTVFKGSIILKTDCRLLKVPSDIWFMFEKMS